MASYFDQKPPGSQAPPAALIPGEELFGKMSLLSPQVTRILDDIELEEKSSDDEDVGLSGDSDASDKHASTSSKAPPSVENLRKAQTSPLLQSKKQIQISASPRPSGAKGKHPNLARFQSLRTMLFSSHIEDSMSQSREQQEMQAAESKWKADYDSRKGRGRPKTPESPTKDGFTHRVGNKLKRLTSKDVPTMSKIQEGGDNESTASSDDDEERNIALPYPDSDEDINHSDIEELRRWVTKRDPPSDGEVRSKQVKAVPKEPQDSGHESLGHSDVEDLVRWVSRRDQAQPDEHAGKEEHVALDHAYSDASTESDDDVAQAHRESIQEDDVDDLVRWISHKDGPKAGPVREIKPDEAIEDSSSDDEKDEDVAELVRWVTRKGQTSGESDVAEEKSVPTANDNKLSVPNQPKDGSKLRDQLS